MYFAFTMPALLEDFTNPDTSELITNDLDGTCYYLLMASGQMNGQEPEGHDDVKYYSTDLTDFGGQGCA